MEDKDYALVHLERLAEALTEDWFLNTIELVTKPSELYDVEISESMGYSVERTIKAEYAIKYFQRLQFYRELIDTYIKND